MRLVKTLVDVSFTHTRLRMILGVIGFGACVLLNQAQARSVAWPSFGPVQQVAAVDLRSKQ